LNELKKQICRLGKSHHAPASRPCHKERSDGFDYFHATAMAICLPKDWHGTGWQQATARRTTFA
jgi:hypothetical protein